MITNASISLLVVENGKLVEKPLGKVVELETEENYKVLVWRREDASHQAVWDSLSEGLNIEYLVEQFMEANFEIRNRLQTLITHYNPKQQLIPNVAFASGEAYKIMRPKVKKEKEGDADIASSAHYNPNSLTYTSSLPAIARSGYHPTIHEQFHHYHFILHRLDYLAADDTMSEVMPIFGQQLFGIYRGYDPDTKHGRAQEILRRLAQTQFQRWPFERQWEFLKGYTKHESLLDATDVMVDLHEIAEPVFEGIEV